MSIFLWIVAVLAAASALLHAVYFANTESFLNYAGSLIAIAIALAAARRA